MQFVETARRLELHAFSVCTKSPKRYSTLLTNRIFELASTVHDEVRAANNIYPKNKHEAQMRRDHLTNANIALQNLSPKLTLLYDAILQNPEKCPWIDHAMKEFGEYIVDEAQLISKVKYLCLECADLICQEIGLELNRKKTVVVPLEDFYRWLKTKFILTPTGKVVLKMNKESTKIIRRKLRSFKGKYENGAMTLKDIRSSLDSYHGHMKRGNSYKVCQSTDHYFKSLFGFYPDKKGWNAHV